MENIKQNIEDYKLQTKELQDAKKRVIRSVKSSFTYLGKKGLTKTMYIHSHNQTSKVRLGHNDHCLQGIKLKDINISEDRVIAFQILSEKDGIFDTPIPNAELLLPLNTFNNPPQLFRKVKRFLSSNVSSEKVPLYK